MSVSPGDIRRSHRPTRSVPKRLARVAALAASLAFCTLGSVGFMGCDGAFLTEAPVQVCKEVLTQCQLAKGPLGVCERAVCAENQEEPCFVCTPQH